jgi:hypothetical protein
MVDGVRIAVPRFRHVWNWNCLGESAARRPRPHVQRHLSGELICSTVAFGHRRSTPGTF